MYASHRSNPGLAAPRRPSSTVCSSLLRALPWTGRKGWKTEEPPSERAVRRRRGTQDRAAKRTWLLTNSSYVITLQDFCDGAPVGRASCAWHANRVCVLRAQHRCRALSMSTHRYRHVSPRSTSSLAWSDQAMVATHQSQASAATARTSRPTLHIFVQRLGAGVPQRSFASHLCTGAISGTRTSYSGTHDMHVPHAQVVERIERLPGASDFRCCHCRDHRPIHAAGVSTVACCGGFGGRDGDGDGDGDGGAGEAAASSAVASPVCYRLAVYSYRRMATLPEWRAGPTSALVGTITTSATSTAPAGATTTTTAPEGRASTCTINVHGTAAYIEY